MKDASAGAAFCSVPQVSSDASREIFPVGSKLEQGAVADGRERWGAARSPLDRDFPSGRPAPAFKDSGEREFHSALAEDIPHAGREAIQQRHRQCAPLDDRLAQRIKGPLQQGGVSRLNGSAIYEETAIAVLGETGQPIEFGAPQSRRGKRLDERVGEPLAELVKRHEPVAGNGGMSPAIAERNA